MKCLSCGHANREDAAFCTSCGARLTEPTGTSAPEPALRHCPHCGVACAPGMKFCPSCGGRLAPFMAEPVHRPSDPTLPPEEFEFQFELPPREASPAAVAAAVASAAQTEMPPDMYGAGSPAPPPPRAEQARPPPVPPVRPRPIPKGGSESRHLVLGILIGATLLAAGAGYWAYRVITDPFENVAIPLPLTAIPAPMLPAVVEPAAAPRDAGGNEAPVSTGDDETADAVNAVDAEADIEADLENEPAEGEPSVTVAAPRTTRLLYRDGCASCHERGERGSPRVDRPEDWDGLLQRPAATLASRVIAGHGGAPAGAGVELTDEEARRLVVRVSQRVERASREAEAARLARLAAEQREREATERAAVRATPPSPPPAAPDWRAQLRSELEACAPLDFFPRIACREKARWTHCNNRWDGAPECAGTQ